MLPHFTPVFCWRSGNGILECPTSADAAKHAVVADSQITADIFQAANESICRENFVSPSVTRLNERRRPTAISGFVIAIVINAINGFSGWAFPHILKKPFKRMFPGVAHGYSAAPIVFIILMLWAVAPTFNPIPSLVGSGSEMVPCVTVLTLDGSSTTARLAVAGREASTSDHFRAAAIAKADTHSTISATSVAFRNDFKLSKREPNQRMCRRHSNGSRIVMFSSGSRFATVSAATFLLPGFALKRQA